ncbi:MAG: hypothetical protein OXF25_00465 [Cyanobacteria bacterium MAG CAR3_bin_5]|nr:hypothetical protein [Cyanobacteria bacterium MAG CAR3_bin_5]
MKRALLVPVLLSPWLLAVWVGFHNLRQPPRHLQLLTGTTPPLPIGGWLLLSSSLGATLGAATVGVLLRTEPLPRRRWRQAGPEDPPYGDEADDGVTGEEPDDPGPRYWGGAESSPGEPPPIMDVPFRVVRAARRTPDPSPSPPTSAPPTSAPAASRDDDDWQSSRSEGW